MTAIADQKSPAQNRLEGFALTALLRGFPTYAGVVLLMKLSESRQIVGGPIGPAIFITIASLVHAWLTPILARRFPRLCGQNHDAVFYDANLSFTDKIARWRVAPRASVELVTMVLLLSLLVVAAASMR